MGAFSIKKWVNKNNTLNCGNQYRTKRESFNLSFQKLFHHHTVILKESWLKLIPLSSYENLEYQPQCWHKPSDQLKGHRTPNTLHC